MRFVLVTVLLLAMIVSQTQAHQNEFLNYEIDGIQLGMTSHEVIVIIDNISYLSWYETLLDNKYLEHAHHYVEVVDYKYNQPRMALFLDYQLILYDKMYSDVSMQDYCKMLSAYEKTYGCAESEYPIELLHTVESSNTDVSLISGINMPHSHVWYDEDSGGLIGLQYDLDSQDLKEYLVDTVSMRELYPSTFGNSSEE